MRGELIKGLVIDRIIKHKSNKDIKFYISNIDELDFKDTINTLYGLLFTNTKFKTFTRNKILDLKGKVNNKYVTVSKDNRVSNLTSKEDFVKLIKSNSYLLKVTITLN